MKTYLLTRRSIIAIASLIVGCAAANGDDATNEEPTGESADAVCRRSQFTASGVDESAAYANARS